MRKSLLVLTVLFVSATAHAAGTRGLSVPDSQRAIKPFKQAEVTVLPAPDEKKPATQPAIETPKPVEQSPVEQMKPVSDAPKATGKLPARAKAVDTQPADKKTVKVRQAEREPHAKPRKKRVTTEARIRSELGRYGITW